MGSLERFALVITSKSGAPAANRRCCNGVYGSITPSSSLSGATPGSSTLASASTIGRATEASRASASAGEIHNCSRRLDITRHHREGLFLAIFPVAQCLDGSRITRVARQVISAEAFYRQNLAFTQKFSGALNRGVVADRDFVCIFEGIVRSALRTGDRLRMKAAVGRIVILAIAVRVQRPRLHRGVRPIVRQSQNHRVTRPAIGAVDVGIAIARILLVEKLVQTLLAYRQVRRNPNRRVVAPLALANLEPVQNFPSPPSQLRLPKSLPPAEPALESLRRSATILSRPLRHESQRRLRRSAPSRQSGARARVDTRTDESRRPAPPPERESTVQSCSRRPVAREVAP